MKEKDWTERLRKRMADHREPVDEGLWAAIEQSLDAGRGRSKRAVFISLRRRMAIAAAAVVLLVGTAYVLLRRQGGEAGQTVRVYRADRSMGYRPQAGTLSPTGVLSVPDKGIVYSPKVAEPQGTLPVNDTDEQLVLAQNTVEKTPVELPPDSSEYAVSHQKSTYLQTAPYIYNGDGQPVLRHRSEEARVSMNLYAFNSMGDYQGRTGTMMTENMIGIYDIPTPQPGMMYAKHEPVYMADTHEETHHRQPIAFGLSVSYRLTDRWSVASGMVYTRLSSDFDKIIGADRITKRQTLHYIGVPLTLNYRIWGNKRLAVYAGAGGEADINVAAKTATEGVSHTIDKDKMQWSMNASVGIQYNILPQLGAYMEPGAKYYFNNGSAMENFFKDKPLNFSLQVGLRFNVK